MSLNLLSNYTVCFILRTEGPVILIQPFQSIPFITAMTMFSRKFPWFPLYDKDRLKVNTCLLWQKISTLQYKHIKISVNTEVRVKSSPG